MLSTITTYITSLSRRSVIIIAVAVLVLGYIAYAAWPRAPKMDTQTIARGMFTQQVTASGKVTPAREVDLGFTQSGRIAGVYAAVGDRVAAGATLARLDSGDLSANLLQRQAVLASQEAKLASMRQGTRPEEIAVAEASVESSKTALDRADTALLDAIRTAYATADSAVRNDVYQFISNPRGTNPQLNFIVSDSQTGVDVINGVGEMESLLTAWQASIATLDESRAASAATAAQANLARVSALLEKASAALNRAQPNQSVTTTNIAAYTADISGARTSINSVSSSLTGAVTSRRSAASALESAQRNLTLKRAGPVQADIDAQLAQVQAAEADVENARSMLSKTVISAPFAGTVTTVDAKTGAIASPNTSLISMIGAGTFQIESYIPEINIALVKPGDRVSVTLDAYGEDVKFGAVVVSIDPAETIKDGVPTYRAVVQFDEADDRIRSGMTANLVITTAERDGVLTVPAGVVTSRDGGKYVKVLDGEAVIERQVTIGETSSLGMTEVLSGLSEGDVIVLSVGQ